MPAMMAVDPTHTLAAASGDAWWLSEFRAFTWQHVLTSGTAILIMAGVSLLGRRWRRRAPARETALRRVWVGGVIALAALTITWWLLPANFDIQISLPLHVCDLAALLVIPTMLTEIRWMRALLYFWAIGLSTQAFFTPILGAGVGEMEFWLFWVGHTQIVGSAIYDIVARGFRPRVRDLGVALAISLLYVAIVFPIDWAFGLNYGYVGPAAPEGTIVTALGPWPQRVPIIVTLGCLAIVLAWLPWGVATRLRSGDGGADAMRSPADEDFASPAQGADAGEEQHAARARGGDLDG